MSVRDQALGNEKCRQCTSFNEYFKESRKKFKKEAEKGETGDNDPEVMKPRREDCPLDKDELGNKTWGFLHTMAGKYPEKPTPQQKRDMCEFFRIFSNFYPCDHCAKDLRQDLKTDPPKLQSQDELSQWLCRLHNKVNLKIGKPEFDCSKVNERWRDGWLDGSCD